MKAGPISDSVRRSARWAAAAVTAVLAAAGLLVGATGTAQAQQDSTTAWLCRPDTPGDPCHLPTDTTDLATGAVTPADPVPQSREPVDCFYVYPTVSNQIAPVADPVASPEVQSIARYQAARFSKVCRVFAPLYRQTPIVGIAPALLGARSLLEPGYADVLAAWKYYLAHDNHGRGVILIGHSQGTMMLRKLIRENIDPNPQIRHRLVGAFLMGGNVTTAAGSTTGGDFTNIPLCTRPGQDGCVVAYSTERLGVPSLFGNADLDLISGAMGLPSGPGHQVACTDPAVLAGDDRPVGLTVPSAPYAFGFISVLLDYTAFPTGLPTSASSWTTSRSRGTGQCVTTAGFHRYRINLTGPDALNEIPLFNTHLADINFGLDRLISIARQQAHTWTAAH